MSLPLGIKKAGEHLVLSNKGEEDRTSPMVGLMVVETALPAGHISEPSVLVPIIRSWSKTCGYGHDSARGRARGAAVAVLGVVWVDLDRPESRRVGSVRPLQTGHSEAYCPGSRRTRSCSIFREQWSHGRGHEAC